MIFKFVLWKHNCFLFSVKEKKFFKMHALPSFFFSEEQFDQNG